MKLYDPNPGRLLLDDVEMTEMAKQGLVREVPEGTSWLLPEQVANTLQVYNEPFKLSSFLRAVDAFNNMWKPIVTVFPLNVSYFTRNEIGLVQNLHLAGMPTWDIPVFGVRAGKMMKEGIHSGVDDVVLGGKKYNQSKLYEEWQINGGLFAGQRDVPPIDLVTGAPESMAARFERKRASLLGQRPSDGRVRMDDLKALLGEYGNDVRARNGKNVFAWGTTFNEGMDNHARITLMLWRMEKFGDTPAQAARQAAKWIGNYTELGAFTAEGAAFLPFFRWSRFNIPIQVEGLLRRPYVGSKLGIARGRDADEELLNAEVETLPDWILERHHVLLGKEDDGRLRILRGFGLPIEDLNKLFALSPRNTFLNALSEITPILRVPLELGIDMSFFTGEPISNKDKSWNFFNRAWGWTENVPGLRNFLELQQLERPNGDIFYRADPVKMYIFSAIISRPGFELDRIGRIAEERDVMTAINFVSGVKFSKLFPDPPERMDIPTQARQDPVMRELYRQYLNIPIYPQFGDPELSNKADDAISSINAFRRGLEGFTGGDVSFLQAAEIYAEDDAEGAGLAMMVKESGWKQEGRKLRDQFKKENPRLLIAGLGLTTRQLEILKNTANP
jgi:hypothetical protein